MGGFFAAALAFPTALFSFALVVVVGYWLLTLISGLGFDAVHGGHGVGHHVGAGHAGHVGPVGHVGHGAGGHGVGGNVAHGASDGHGAGGSTHGSQDGNGHHGGVLDALGLGGVPVTVTVSLLVTIAWFVSLAGTVLTSGAPARGGVFAVALVASWAGTRLLVRPLSRLFPQDHPVTRGDFVGRVCVIRTGRVTADFGQAEVTAEDGSTATVQVRTPEPDPGLTAGRTALIYDYDADGEHFLVAPFDPPSIS
ncbi:OB-fold-containig protein [Kitasatospora sp. SUK 42]|uniref:OB-fold-containig protein n=1 Tax=Kitasatospora sp. SUK 42 TaxID=1588882 RepID=UPI0018CAAF44|nr:OB-fold-containig protein [Kitasatospora sp. SUK 42]MBV2151531.1 YqiJ family protein [Kitasatospora sp. SUK 42]